MQTWQDQPMIFYRSPHSDSPRAGPSLSAIRLLTGLSLAAYPAGAIVRALAPTGRAGMAYDIVGFALILLALAAAAPVLGSYAQRITSEEASKLDEFELHWRERATTLAYAIFTGLTLAFIFYLGVASDAGWWVPRGYDAYNGLFWGAFLYAMLLPTAVLAWRLDGSEQ
jgi:MFS family permease